MRPTLPCLCAFLLAVLMVVAYPPPTPAAQGGGRLSQLIRQKPLLYLPSRLVIGETNRFVLRGKPGSNVTLYFSPEARGFTLPNQAMAMNVGADPEALSGVVPENGVLTFELPMPEDKTLDGRLLYIDGIVWQATDFSDLEKIVLQDANGYKTVDNSLPVVLKESAGGARIMPNIPGINPQVLNQLNTLSDVHRSKDGRKKNLLDTGELNRDENLIDRNSFYNRPGQLTPGL